MHELVERYIYDVTRRLPERERDEVRRELEANIADMLPDDPTAEDVAAVLNELGAPSKLAEQYRQKPRYLISPALFDTYISALKKVLPIVALAVAGAVALAELFQASDIANIGELIARVIGRAIGGAFEGALFATFWVTLGFVIAERKGSYKEKIWTVSDLPNLPDKAGVSISLSGTIVSMALAVFFTAIIVLIIVQYDSMLILVHKSVVIHPFTQEALYRSIPFIVLMGCLSLGVSGIKLYYGRWNLTLAIVNFAHNILWVSIMIYILHWPDLFHPTFLAHAEGIFTARFDILSYISSGGTALFFSAILALAAAIDSAVGFRDAFKGSKGGAAKG